MVSHSCKQASCIRALCHTLISNNDHYHLSSEAELKPVTSVVSGEESLRVLGALITFFHQKKSHQQLVREEQQHSSTFFKRRDRNTINKPKRKNQKERTPTNQN
jgi:hypothetical protein